MEEFRTQTVGYLWQSGKGKDACPKCAALHGREFYYDPRPGQASVAEMPEPPIHPNCRCTIQPLLDLPHFPEKLQTEHPSIKPYMKDVYRLPGAGLLFRRNGDNFIPIWGKWCGPQWSAGRETEDPSAESLANADPEDSLDAACMNHDDCYDRHDQHGCDKKLIDHLLSLPDDPGEWPNPPKTTEEIDDASKYRKFAVAIFTIKYAWHEYMVNRRED